MKRIARFSLVVGLALASFPTESIGSTPPAGAAFQKSHKLWEACLRKVNTSHREAVRRDCKTSEERGTCTFYYYKQMNLTNEQCLSCFQISVLAYKLAQSNVQHGKSTLTFCADPSTFVPYPSYGGVAAIAKYCNLRRTGYRQCLEDSSDDATCKELFLSLCPSEDPATESRGSTLLEF